MLHCRNPVIPGFHPDPSICHVGEDFYLVNSSFEYFPGIPIFHSLDLVHWRQIGHCLTRKSQLPLDGVKPSDGVYAPTIRYFKGLFYMVVTRVELKADGTKVHENFYVTTPDPAGEWSEPVFVEQSGIDPSLWFEEDGTTYFTSNGTGWANVRGAYQCVIDPKTGERVSDSRFLWTGTGDQYPEAPHLFKRAGFYYLLLAEGGTQEGHMVTVARSTSPWGPFESCPHNPLLSHRSLMLPIQATGHADFVEDQYGEWWAVFLGIRYAEHGYHNLGRETFHASVGWTDNGWPTINGGNPVALCADLKTELMAHLWPEEPERDNFDTPDLRFSWNFLRNPQTDSWSLVEQPGSLTLRCLPETLNDLASPAFVGRRQENFECEFSAELNFNPEKENEEAGLVALLDHRHHCSVAITRREGKSCIIVNQRIGDLFMETARHDLIDGNCILTILANRSHYQLGYRAGVELTILSKVEVRYLCTEIAGGYTGVYLGMYATGNGKENSNAASFGWCEYKTKNPDLEINR